MFKESKNELLVLFFISLLNWQPDKEFPQKRPRGEKYFLPFSR
jgi:hypothetical protein